MLYGYVRVSTVEQNVGRQLLKMAELGIPGENVFVDRASGRDMDRPEWRRLSDTLREGDSLVVDSLDRLGRDYDAVTAEWRSLTRDRGVSVRCLDLEFFDSARFAEMGDLGVCLEDMLLSLLSYVAQSERRKTLQRQAEGIAVAKANGVYRGRAPMEPGEAVRAAVERYRAGEIGKAEAAREAGVSRATLYRMLADGRV